MRKHQLNIRGIFSNKNCRRRADLPVSPRPGTYQKSSVDTLSLLLGLIFPKYIRHVETQQFSSHLIDHLFSTRSSSEIQFFREIDV